MNDLLSDDGNDLPTIDVNKNYLEELVGDGKKFKTVEDLARGKFEADLTVELFKKRQDELRNSYLSLKEEHEASARLTDLIDQIKAEKQQLASNTQPKVNEVNSQTLDLDAVRKAAREEVSLMENTRKQDTNFADVESKLKERYGANYKSVLKQHADELGLTPEDVNSLARKSPNAFFKTFGLDEQQRTEGFQSPPRNERRNDNFLSGSPKRSWTYYQDMKAKNSRLYYDAKTQNQMIDDYRALGKDFEDGNFTHL